MNRVYIVVALALDTLSLLSTVNIVTCSSLIKQQDDPAYMHKEYAENESCFGKTNGSQFNQCSIYRIRLKYIDIQYINLNQQRYNSKIYTIQNLFTAVIMFEQYAQMIVCCYVHLFSLQSTHIYHTFTKHYSNHIPNTNTIYL